MILLKFFQEGNKSFQEGTIVQRVKNLANYFNVLKLCRVALQFAFRKRHIRDPVKCLSDEAFCENDEWLKLLNLFVENLCYGCSTRSLNTSLESYQNKIP